MLLVWFRYGGPAPRFDVLGVVGLGLGAGGVWVVATWRAPGAGAGAGAADRGAMGAGRVPSGVPRPGLVRFGPVVASLLGLVALVPAVFLGQLPDGEQQKTIRGLQDAGTRVGTGTVVSLDGDKHSEVGFGSRRSGGSYYFASVRVRVPDGGVVLVERGITAGTPAVGEEFDVLYVPGRPELGGWVDESDDVRAFVPGWRLRMPPSGPVPLVIVGLVALAFGAAMATGVGSRGQRRVLVEDAAAGRVHAMRVERMEAVLETRTVPGLRAGRVSESTLMKLRAVGPGGAVELGARGGQCLGHGREFGGGWLCVARRWTMAREKDPLPVVFVADDGRVFWSTVRPAEVRELSRPRGFEERETVLGAKGLRFDGFCGTDPRTRAALVGVYAALAVVLLPVLTGHTTHLVGWLTTVPAVLAAVAATVCVSSAAERRLRGDDGWTRVAVRDPRIPA